MIAQNLIHDYQMKWMRIQKVMQEKGADGCLISNGINLFYTTGHIYSGYFYLPAEGEPWYFVKRPNGLAGEHVVYLRKPEQLPDLFRENGLQMPQHLLLEADELTYSDYTRLQTIFQPQTTGNATALLRQIRRVKTPWEIEQTRLCARRHEAVYQEIPSCFRPGMTDLDFQFEIENRMRKHGSLGLFRAFGPNMDIYMGSILAGPNAETPSPFDFALGGGGMDASCPLGANGTPLEELSQEQLQNLNELDWDMLGITSDDIMNLLGEIPKDVQIQEIENAPMPQFLKDELIENNNSTIYGELGVNSFPRYVAAYISRLVLNLLSFLVTFLLAIIIVKALMFAVNIIGELPVLGLVNHIAGAGLGLVLAVVIVWLGFLIMTLAYTTEVGMACFDMMEKSQILQFLYDTNPLLIRLVSF